MNSDPHREKIQQLVTPTDNARIEHWRSSTAHDAHAALLLPEGLQVDSCLKP